MSRYLIVTWDGAGNLVSTLGIAQRLAEQGHDVRLLGHRSIDQRVGSHGWRFRPLERTFDFDSTAPMDPDLEMATMSRELWLGGSVAHDVLDELEREPADVLVADAMLLGAISAGEAADIPTVALFHAAYALMRGGMLVDLLSPALPDLNTVRAELGLPAVDGIPEVHDACTLNLVALPREFEPPIPVPDNVRFIGPVLDGPALTRTTDELVVADGPEPLVVVSLSTSYQGQVELIQRLVDALGALPVRVVVTTGPAVEHGSIRPAANTTVVGFVPHTALLPNASLVVTHAGLGTVMASLGHGVPMLCVPMGRDQFFNASRVEELGAGRMLGPDANEETIAQVVRELLDDPGAREGAKRMAGVIAGYGGADDAVAELARLG
jgi:MGT family glycosyltransferase